MSYNPNHIPSNERTTHILLSTVLFLWGTYGILRDDLSIPTKRGPTIHLHGEKAWIMYAAFLFCIASMLSIVVDHYDKRDNEINYKWFARICQGVGWSLFLLAFYLEGKK